MILSYIAGTANGWILVLKRRILWLKHVYMFTTKVYSLKESCNGMLELYYLLVQIVGFGI